MTRFQGAYEAKCDGFTLNYTSNGSGTGVKELTGKQTDIGGSDSSLSKEKAEYDAAKTRCDGNDAWDLPAVFGPVAVTYNVQGVDGIVLDGPTLAKIFQGQVSTWNDAAITALNSGKNLPSTKIVVIFRNDESGTTDNFQKYLKAASKGAWTKPTGKTFNGGVGEARRATRAPRPRSRPRPARSRTTSGPSPRSRICRSPRSSIAVAATPSAPTLPPAWCCSCSRSL